MLSTFATAHGMFIIRSEDLRCIEDRPGVPPNDTVCYVTVLLGDKIVTTTVCGTAAENLDRLRREELQQIAEAEARHARFNQGLPIVPVQRGRGRP